MNIQKLNDYLAGRYVADAMDEAPRKHADGTPCEAKSPEACPFNRSAEKAERLEPQEGFRLNEWIDKDGNETELFKTEASLKESWKDLRNGNKIIAFVVPVYGCKRKGSEGKKWNLWRVTYDTVTKRAFGVRGYKGGNRKFDTKEEALAYAKGESNG